MHRPTRRARLAVAVALSIALAAPTVSAQTPPPPPGPAAPAAASSDTTPAADPPARAGRVARIVGEVSFHGPGADQWEPATLNFPVTDGDAVWTQPGALAAIDLAGGRITLAGGTELSVDKLDARTTVASMPQGEVYLRLRHLAPGETYTLFTRRGSVGIAKAGRYGVYAGDSQHPTMVTVLEGQAQLFGSGLNVTVAAGQTARITGDTSYAASLGPLQADAFASAMEQEAEAPPPPPPPQPPPPVAGATPAVAPPAVVETLPGARDLTPYGQWVMTPDYGTVWIPAVAPGWVPYRDGRWVYIEPWGWTWVDDAPWGFAPFHYGRWVQLDGVWAWAPLPYAIGEAPPPVYEEPPVYAPALVVFVGVGVGVGWCPLGWGEPYRPWYHTSPRYRRDINPTFVHEHDHVTTFTNHDHFEGHYINQHATTAVPTATLVGSRPVAGDARPLSREQLAGLRPVESVPVRPTAATAGVTPAVARQLNPPAGQHGVATRPAAPGPAIPPPVARSTAAPVPGIARPAEQRPVARAPAPAPAPRPAPLPEVIRPSAPQPQPAPRQEVQPQPRYVAPQAAQAPRQQRQPTYAPPQQSQHICPPSNRAC
jgi:hypothetical protein